MEGPRAPEQVIFFYCPDVPSLHAVTNYQEWRKTTELPFFRFLKMYQWSGGKDDDLDSKMKP
jgi:hypothetical protein